MRLERVSIAAVSVLFVAACGGDASTNAAGPGLAPSTDDAATEQQPDDGGDAAPAGDDPAVDGGGDVTDGAGPTDDASPTDGESPTDEESAPPVDDYSTVEVLDVSDGSTTTLRGAVTGDRPVLVWFWAPH